ncbi:hypothetical protein BDW22DRAFT_1034762 [Trametopsis cervina]|nr:hypothetical protein BDW22DRAFT_1034762 [Trametopsis cervina]
MGQLFVLWTWTALAGSVMPLGTHQPVQHRRGLGPGRSRTAWKVRRDEMGTVRIRNGDNLHTRLSTAWGCDKRLTDGTGCGMETLIAFDFRATACVRGKTCKSLFDGWECSYVVCVLVRRREFRG